MTRKQESQGQITNWNKHTHPLGSHQAFPCIYSKSPMHMCQDTSAAIRVFLEGGKHFSGSPFTTPEMSDTSRKSCPRLGERVLETPLCLVSCLLDSPALSPGLGRVRSPQALHSRVLVSPALLAMVWAVGVSAVSAGHVLYPDDPSSWSHVALPQGSVMAQMPPARQQVLRAWHSCSRDSHTAGVAGGSSFCI